MFIIVALTVIYDSLPSTYPTCLWLFLEVNVMICSAGEQGIQSVKMIQLQPIEQKGW